MKLQGTYRLFPSGTAVSGATVGLYLVGDLVTPVQTTTTGSDGSWSLSRNFHPGKFMVKITDSVNGVTRWMSSSDSVMMGANSSYDFNYLVAALGDGVHRGVGSGLSASASGLSTTVTSGSCSVKGVVVSPESSTVLAHDAHHASLARRDRIVVRVTRLGQTDEGKSELAIIKGTASASPALPALTQSSSVWEMELWEVSVPATSGALVFTDRRVYVGEASLALPAPVLTAFSSTSAVSSFAGTMTSIYSGTLSGYNDVSDAVWEAYVQVSISAGTLTLQAYVDGVATGGGPSMQVTGPRTVTVPLRHTFGPLASDVSRTIGIAAMGSGVTGSVLGYSGYVTQYRRS